MKKLIGAMTTLLLVSNTFAATQTTTNPEFAITPSLKLVAKSQHESDDTSKYTVNVRFPQISGNMLSAHADQFNQKINELASTSITQFKMQIVNGAAGTLPPDANRNTLNIIYDASVVYPQHHPVLSIRMDEEAYFAGAAHASHAHDTITYDLITGKTLALEDLFKPKSDWLQTLSTYCGEKLKTTIKTPDTNGFAPSPDNFKLWNLEPNGLRITFTEYQVAPYYYGHPTVLIPYKVLQSVVNPDSLIGGCVKNNKC